MSAPASVDYKPIRCIESNSIEVSANCGGKRNKRGPTVAASDEVPICRANEERGVDRIDPKRIHRSGGGSMPGCAAIGALEKSSAADCIYCRRLLRIHLHDDSRGQQA